jgi:hypothetical protein
MVVDCVVGGLDGGLAGAVGGMDVVNPSLIMVGRVAGLRVTKNATPLSANAIKMVKIKKRIDAILFVETPAVFPKVLLTFCPTLLPDLLNPFAKLFIYSKEIL